MMFCPCTEKHYKTVRLTPSGIRYAVNLRNYLSNLPCWDTEEG